MEVGGAGAADGLDDTVSACKCGVGAELVGLAAQRDRLTLQPSAQGIEELFDPHALGFGPRRRTVDHTERIQTHLGHMAGDILRVLLENCATGRKEANAGIVLQHGELHDLIPGRQSGELVE